MNRFITCIFLTLGILCKASATTQVPDTALVFNTDSTIMPQRNIESLITIDTISCINFNANTITFNGADWSQLFQSIDNLRDTIQQNIVSIVHLGDSHVQAGFFTEAMRIPMQMKWGNAGRGLITPLKITKTNEPFDYRFTSETKWRYNRCLGKHFSSRVGVGGILIEPVTNDIDLFIETMSLYGEDTKFNRIRLFHTPADSFPQLQIVDEPQGLVMHSPAAFWQASAHRLSSELPARVRPSLWQTS